MKKSKHIILKLTYLEAQELLSVAGNGWGDGDFAEWQNKQETAAYIRAMKKLRSSIFK